MSWFDEGRFDIVVLESRRIGRFEREMSWGVLRLDKKWLIDIRFDDEWFDKEVFERGVSMM